ncbi:hypothetical protein EV182_004043, partial [Spiromyces aspiralis]
VSVVTTAGPVSSNQVYSSRHDGKDPARDPRATTTAELFDPSDLKRVRFSLPILLTEFEDLEEAEETSASPSLSPVSAGDGGGPSARGKHEHYSKTAVEGGQNSRRGDDESRDGSALWDIRDISRREYTLDQVLDIYYRTCWNLSVLPLSSVEEAFRARIALNQSMPALVLSGTAFSPQDMRAFSEILDLKFGLRKLELEHCGLDDESVRLLTYSLMCADAVRYLSVAHNSKITHWGLKSIATYIFHTRELYALNLSGIRLDKRGAMHLSDALAGTKMLAAPGRHAEGAERQSSAVFSAPVLLSEPVTLRILYLDGCRIEPHVLESMVPGIRRSPLQFLSLRNNALSTKHGTALYKLLCKEEAPSETDPANEFTSASDPEGDRRRQPNFQALDLSQNSLRPVILNIAEALLANTTLKELALCQNGLDHDSLAILARCLASNKGLTSLDISRNPMCSPDLGGVTELKLELPQNKTLQCLFMSDTKLTTEGAILLAECLPELTCLQRLEIASNRDIEVAGILALSASIKSNRSLLCLEVSINESDDLAYQFEREIAKSCIANMERQHQETLKAKRK